MESQPMGASSKVRLCSVSQCGKSVEARGLCSMHYQRARYRKEKLPPRVRPERIKGAMCAVENCPRAADKGALCNAHYIRIRVHGSPHVLLKPPKGEVIDWLRQHVNYADDGCLLWPFFKHNGRGYINFEGRPQPASRLMCKFAHGGPPFPHAHAAHSCGRGHDGCVNPRHLRWATAKENSADKRQHGTLRRGEQIKSAKLTEEQVRAIRRDRRTQVEIANEYGVSRRLIGAIKGRQRWAHVPD